MKPCWLAGLAMLLVLPAFDGMRDSPKTPSVIPAASSVIPAKAPSVIPAKSLPPRKRGAGIHSATSNLVHRVHTSPDSSTPAFAQSPWRDFQILEWQPRTPAQLATLKLLGVTGGMAPVDRGTSQFDRLSETPAALRSQGLSYYIENIATDFYAAYHRWTPGKRPGWRFAELQARYAADPKDVSVFVRDPSLSDPAWLEKITGRLTAVARTAAMDHPVYYNLGDETGIAELAAPWDFDLSRDSLADFRLWLRTQYPSLAALNDEWGTSYTAWDQVQPELTRDAVNSRDANLARWADFKAWMDVAFARALRAGTDAVHRGDPAGRAAIEGAQVPGWGGYDYTLLAHALDVMEIYDTLENLAIAESLNPGLVTLTTSFGAGPQQIHAIWRAFLRGTRGLVLWDDKNRIVNAGGSPGPDAANYRPVFAALRGTVGQAVLHARRAYDPIAILYSPASFRISWMLEQRPQGQSWVTRSLDDDDLGDAQSQSLAAYAQALTHLGFTPSYIGPDALARGEFGGARVLILPHAVALSPGEREAIARFAAHGGTVVADTAPGGFDAHGKPATILDAARIVAPSDRSGLAQAIEEAGVKTRFAVSTDGAAALATYVFADGPRTILAVQQDFEASGSDMRVDVMLPDPMMVTDLLSGASLGQVSRLSFRLDPVRPAVFRLEPVGGTGGG